MNGAKYQELLNSACMIQFLHFGLVLVGHW